MKTKLMNNIGIMLCMIVTIVLSSCVSSVPRRVYVPGAEAPIGYSQPQQRDFRYQGYAPGSSADRRLQGARGFMHIKGTESLSPIDPTPDAYRNIVSGKRFIRDSDGIISESVLRTIANGGVIGWDGQSFCFEGPVQEETGITDRLTVTEVAKACIKYRKLPSPQSDSGRLVRAKVIELERDRGHVMR